MASTSVLMDCGVPMSSNASCMDAWGVLGKAFAMSSRHTMASSAANKQVSSCMACLVGVQPLRLPYWCGDSDVSGASAMQLKLVSLLSHGVNV